MADSGKVSKCKLDVNIKDGSDYTLLHQVVMKGKPLRVEETDVNNLKLLLKFHPDVNIINALTSEGDNILHLAIKNKRSLEMVKIITKAFLDNGVDINLADGKGFTAFYYALWPLSFNYQGGGFPQNYSNFNFKFTDAEIVQHLVEKGSRIDMVDKNGYSPLLLAVVLRRTDYVKILLDNKDKLSDGALEKTVNTFYFQLNFSVQYPPVEYYGMTPLQIAVYDNNKEMTKMLITAGADVDAANTNNNRYSKMTPLQISVNKCNPEMSEILIKAGADVNVVSSGNNLLQIIIIGDILNEKRQAIKEQTQIAKLLIDSGIDLNAGSPLQLALHHNKHDIVTAILEKGLDTL